MNAFVDAVAMLNNNNNTRSFNMVKTHAEPYKHIIHAYVYNHTTNSLSRRTATTQGLAQGGGQPETDGALSSYRRIVLSLICLNTFLTAIVLSAK